MRGLAAALLLALLPSELHATDPVGRLRVVMSAGWGEVRVDGDWHGLTPVELELPVGVHRIEVPETTWHLAWSGEVLVPDDLVTLTVDRPLRPGSVRIDGVPRSSEPYKRINDR